jgi:hypothetical protein
MVNEQLTQALNFLPVRETKKVTAAQEASGIVAMRLFGQFSWEPPQGGPVWNRS